VVSASDPRALQKGYAAGPGDKRLRLNVILAATAEIAFLMFLTAFLWNHANPMGGGMEMVAVGAAFMFVFLPFTLPALMLAKERRHLAAAFLAGVAAFLYFAFWFETLAELGIREAPWS
jgi:hypothetical protein